ncbi:Arc family DNA-binding protein [Acinetobacter sp. TUM15509]|uniref:Arc family DNA-binding protein n=1 Tax=Acinetobacter sp. TUM15509 TaxID=2609154 RepID=UPI00125E0C77|nr:Arc family DNA-binding protein [Acinetobacter sp. TUM15509]
MARNDPQMNLRVPMELKEKIEKAALDNGRTITAEAVYRLEQSFNEKNIVEEEVVALTSQVKQLLDRLEGGKF